jgi:hypothetical protein
MKFIGVIDYTNAGIFFSIIETMPNDKSIFLYLLRAVIKLIKARPLKGWLG